MDISRMLAGAGILFAFTQAPAMANTCDNALIAGAYSTSVQGFGGTAAPFVPVSVVSKRVFDGHGNTSNAGYISVAGVATAYSGTGKYQVNADCTFSIVSTSTIGPNTQFGVITDNGNKLFTTRLDRGYSTTAEYDRIFRK
jgi:hypothetical protein